MININGWICIRESYNDEMNDQPKLIALIKSIESKIAEELNYDNEHYNLKSVNGEFYLSITIAHNHRSQHPFEFLQWIATNSIGSYGIVYVQDDEDYLRGNENKFKVWRMKKGMLDELNDPFLSPVIPEIEE